MTALTADRNTPYRNLDTLVLGLAAGVKIHTGAIVAANANGYAVPGSTATTLTYLGRADHTCDNSDGGNGEKSIVIRRQKAFKWDNSGADPVTQASLGKPCYIVDDQTVAATNGGNTRSAAGKVAGIDADGVWVE